MAVNRTLCQSHTRGLVARRTTIESHSHSDLRTQSHDGPVMLNNASRDRMMNPTMNLMNALKSHSFSRIRSAIKMPCVDFNHRDVDNLCRTPLMKVCAMSELSANARRDLVKLLLAKQIDLNATDKHGLTALAIACKCGHVGTVRLLSDEIDVDPNVADNDGNTPLIHACRSGKADVVTVLLMAFKKFGLEVNVTNNQGMTALMEAARAGSSEVCRALVQEGQADVNIRDGTSHCTAMDYAIESGRCSTPELLLLSPVAQRRHQARQHLEATGHRTLRDVIEVSNQLNPRSEWLKPTKLAATSKYESYPLPTEVAEHANSMVFQVSKRLQRLSEDSEGETREEAEMEEEKRRAPIRRRYSLPSARHCIYGRNAQFQNQTASGSPRLGRGRGKPEWLKLPPVPETTSLSRSPSPTDNQREDVENKPVQPPTTKSSPPHSPTRLRSRSPTRGKTPKSAPFLPANCHIQARMSSAYEPAIATSSYKRPTLRISHTWEGRPSNTVPSYLFR